MEEASFDLIQFFYLKKINSVKSFVVICSFEPATGVM